MQEAHVDLGALAARGWCALPPSPVQLRLLQLVRQFLAQDAATKGAWVDPCDGARHYMPLQGGREAFTVRDGCLPPALQRSARRAWRHAMQLSHAMLRQVEAAGLSPANRLTELLEPGPLPAAPKSVSLLRHFRCAPAAELGAQVAVGAHADLGLLSFCLEDTPGLEVWDRLACAWRRPPPGEVAVLAGEALCLVTGGAFPPCRHRVIGGPCLRTSQVFHLRLRLDALLDSARLRLPLGCDPFRMAAREFLHWQLSRGPGVNVPQAARVNPRGA